MKRLFMIALIIMGIITIVGCAQRKVAQAPEQPQTQAEAKAPQQAGRESVTEKQLAQPQQAEVQTAFKELDTKVQDIHFDFDKSDIKDDAKPILKALAAMLSKDTKTKVIIEGHCDERGTNEYNLALGDRRSNSTKSYLVSLGIPSGRIQTISYGKEKPLCTEGAEECWAKNRRAHFVLAEERS
ncbi:MAG: peptidoglycan-associated lipoprotein Pal [Nitrospirae bacterium]|nr:peptidoglycan-associated lipoprotein Pal [Nitrospirota bacterium]